MFTVIDWIEVHVHLGCFDLMDALFDPILAVFLRCLCLNICQGS